MTWFRTRRPEAANAPSPIPGTPGGLLQVCHPDWRGVRTSAYAFQDPVFEASDLSALIGRKDDLAAAGVHTIVIQGWPPHASEFAKAMTDDGVRVLAMFHSSPAQHGIDAGEAEAVHEMLTLRRDGVLSDLASVKPGVAKSFRALGHDVTHVGNRVPDLGEVTPRAVGSGTNVGIFLHPMWRKNVTTQILAALDLGWHPFVMGDPKVAYIPTAELTICGELPRDEFLCVLAAMDITLNVTLSECHPMLPMESYRLGVPCLLSRTSDLFIDDPDLYDLTTVDQADNPEAIARAATRLLEHRSEAIAQAKPALDAVDRRSADQWRSFTTQ